LLAALCGELVVLTEAQGDPRQRLSVLEELRPALWQVLAAFDRQHLARTLPFGEGEQARWRSYIEGWSLALAAYMRSLADADQGIEGVAGLAPLLLQRVVRQAVQVAVACYRAYQPVEPALWALLHEHLRRAESCGTADLPVADPTLALEGHGTVTEAFLHLLLLDFCDPYGLTPAQLALANSWTERLARLSRLSIEPVPHGNAGYLAVDLHRPEGLHLHTHVPVIPADASLRFVELAEAREQVKRLLAKLRLGIPPQDLYLGSECTRDEAELLLERIQRRWRASRRRLHPRRIVDETVQLAFGLAAVHRYLLQSATESVESACQDLPSAQLVNQSPSGIGLLQAGKAAGRLRCQQLVALVRQREVVIGSVRWMAVDGTLGLRYGVRVMAGRASPAHIESSATAPGTEELAVLLPALPGLAEPPTLLTSPGIHFPERELRLRVAGGAFATIRLERLLDAGSDFERVSFQSVP
jgi:hypothetical protein